MYYRVKYDECQPIFCQFHAFSGKLNDITGCEDQVFCTELPDLCNRLLHHNTSILLPLRTGVMRILYAGIRKRASGNPEAPRVQRKQFLFSCPSLFPSESGHWFVITTVQVLDSFGIGTAGLVVSTVQVLDFPKGNRDD